MFGEVMSKDTADDDFPNVTKIILQDMTIVRSCSEKQCRKITADVRTNFSILIRLYSMPRTDNFHEKEEHINIYIVSMKRARSGVSDLERRESVIQEKIEKLWNPYYVTRYIEKDYCTHDDRKRSRQRNERFEYSGWGSDRIFCRIWPQMLYMMKQTIREGIYYLKRSYYNIWSNPTRRETFWFRCETFQRSSVNLNVLMCDTRKCNREYREKKRQKDTNVHL